MTYGEVLGRHSTSSQCYVNAMVGWVVSGQDERRLFYFSYSDVENTLLSYTSPPFRLLTPSWLELVSLCASGQRPPPSLTGSISWLVGSSLNGFKQFLLKSSENLKMANTNRLIGPMLRNWKGWHPKFTWKPRINIFIYRKKPGEKVSDDWEQSHVAIRRFQIGLGG